MAPKRAKPCRQKHHYQERGQRCGRKGNPCPLPSRGLNMRVQRQDKQAGDAHVHAYTHTHTHTPQGHAEKTRKAEEGEEVGEGGGEGIRGRQGQG